MTSLLEADENTSENLKLVKQKEYRYNKLLEKNNLKINLTAKEFDVLELLAVYLAEPAADLLAVTFTAILFTVRFKKALQTMENKKIQDT